MILARHWAASMSHPIWICDAGGNLLFYNEAAEVILGVRYDEAGEMPASALSERFVTTDLDGSPIDAAGLPLVVALTDWVPAHRTLRIRAYDGVWRVIEVTAVPLVGEGERRLGAMAIFWQLDA
jgi:PAS domain-containing protein